MSERLIAAENGKKLYATGRPCKRGHLAERYVSTGNCVDCIKESNERFRPKNPDIGKYLIECPVKRYLELKAFADALMLDFAARPAASETVYDGTADRKRMVVNTTKVVDAEWAAAPRPTLWSDPEPIPPKA